ncbi:hypothetical protein [Hymenobacter metallicola]|uniref:Uncharacterized protein n=1 Tax=Hymenobacter metallicola TaxID=2563114 RepID=A0A4Z0QEX1_9BACT|nr:hypothetical protein [Hymenobacter metallicola]TGE28570.1 hypothetical protein E5K02_03645 [Hymenobacter metallicola]
MNKVLLLFGVLFLFLTSEVSAARPSSYARAKAKGRMYVHRPNYKVYKGSKRHRKSSWFRLPKLSQKAGGHRSRF